MAERDRLVPANLVVRALRALLVLAVVVPAFAGCASDGGPCNVGPVPVSSPASAGEQAPAGVRAELGNAGACEIVVEWNDARYADTRVNYGFYDVWAISETDLTPLGPATAASQGLGTMAKDTVYAIDNVDPARAIAMYSWQERVVVMIRQDFPRSLCGYFKTPPTQQGLCPEAETQRPASPGSS